METITKGTSVLSSVKSGKTITIGSEAFWKAADYNRFGIVPALLTIVVCLSSIAAAFAATNGVSMLILVGLPTSMFLTAIISIAPMRLIFLMAILTIIVDIAVYFIH